MFILVLTAFASAWTMFGMKNGAVPFGASKRLANLVVRLVFCCLPALCAAAGSGTITVSLQPDSKLQAAVEDARNRFLAGKPFSRADVFVAVKDATGDTWKSAGVNADSVTYPASSVKLAYLAAAMQYCRENGMQPNGLDSSVRRMIERSDNVQTGVVVDTITGTSNIPDLTSASDARYAPWVEKRKYTMNCLAAYGLLRNQSVFNKTYPSNSGDGPEGAEKIALAAGAGKNQMQPQASAELMLLIATGKLESQATEYMRDVLTHDRWKAAAACGPGFPPGTVHLNKAGWAYTNANDIVYAKLPNGRELVLAVFTDAFIDPYRSDPSPHEKTILSQFAELVIYRAGLVEGCPPALYVTTASPGFSFTGNWERQEEKPDQFAAILGAPANAGSIPPVLRARTDDGSSSSTATWKLDIPESGKYEVCTWYPAAPDACSAATYVISGSRDSSRCVVDQRKVQGRWNRLGDFEFEKGSATVMVNGAGAIADALRIAKWPQQ